MDEVNKSILHNLRNCSYYAEARNWYLRKYIYPIVERSYILAAALVMVTAVLSGLYLVNALFPISVEMPLLIQVEDTIGFQPEIFSLAQEQEDPEVSISRYLLSKYVVTRESYSYNQLEEQVTKIRNTSTKFIYKQFYNQISLENPDSPILIYQGRMRKEVTIESVNFNHEGNNNAIVKFSTIVRKYPYNQEDMVSTTRWFANITFVMSGFDPHDTQQYKNGRANFSFVITNYNVQQIK